MMLLIFLLAVSMMMMVEGQSPRFYWSSAGPIGGKHCVQWIEPSDYAGTWGDNYLCTDRYWGLRWSYAGAISGMKCVQIAEHAEPGHTHWHDNYFCSPAGSPITFSWSMAGPTCGSNRVQILETADPHTWGDNYLCWTYITPRPTPYPTRRPTPYPTKYPTRRPTPYPTKYPTKRPTPYPTKTPSESPSKHPTTNPSAAPTSSPTEEIGCSSTSQLLPLSQVVIPDAIYACSGTWSLGSGGIYGDEAAALCNNGYHICRDAQETEDLGLTEAMCNGITSSDTVFFGTLETSDGHAQCYTEWNDLNPNNFTMNDIWGCATTTAPGVSQPGCGVLEGWIGNNDWNHWILGTETGYPSNEYEARLYALTDASSGGVLCCVDTQCSNDSDCGVNAYCDTSDGECKCYGGITTDDAWIACSNVNECLHSHSNQCDVNAQCIDNDAGYTCVCNTGYFDNSGGLGRDCRLPIDCGYSNWTYGACSKDVCGGGIQTRTRTIIQNEMYGGIACNISTLSEDVACNTDVCCVDGDIKTFNWDTLTEDGIDIPQYKVTTFDIDGDDLSINIVVELDYLANATITDGRIGKFGVTYVLDFEDFDAHQDDITQPGTCQNRNNNDFTSASFEEYWDFSTEPQNTGNIGEPGNYLAYPPPDPVEGEWDVYMKDDGCDTIVYSGRFTWTDLRNCKKYGGAGDSYTDVVSDENWLNLTGTFYINVVSPYWPDSDYGYYRVYQILSQPFVIAVSSVIHVLGSTGINLMTLSVIAVYKEDQESDFKLVLLTETADYLKLTRTSGDIFNFAPDDVTNGITSADFIDNTNPENSGTNECLNNKGYICSQLWEINATNIGCTPAKGTDFSGNYELSFVPECRSTGDTALDSYCSLWLIDHPDIATRVTLDTDLVWTDDICDPIIFTVQFVAAMSFYEDNTFSSPVADDHLYQVGEDTIYVQINTTFPDDTMDVFNVEIVEVHICTFDPLNPPSEDLSDLSTFGCFGARDTQFDKYFYKIYDADDSSVNYDSFQIETEGISNIVRFSFQVPNAVARDTLYVQAELEVQLQELGTVRRRRRVLLSATTEPTANQIENFIDSVGINYGQGLHEEPNNNNNNKEPESPFNNNQPHEYYPKEPMNPNPVSPISPSAPMTPSTWSINLSSLWVIGIGCILGLMLTLNIGFMCYVNYFKNENRRSLFDIFSRRRGGKGYESVPVNNVDTDGNNDSEIEAINVASE